MRFPKAIHWYVAAVCLSAGASLLLVPWSALGSLGATDVAGLLLLTAFILLSERLSVRMALVPKGSHTITFIPLLATVLLFGPAAAVLLIGVSGGIAEVWFRRKEFIRASFNIGQYVLSTSVAGWLFVRAGGSATVGSAAEALIAQLGPFCLYLAVVMVVNQATVIVAIALSQGSGLVDVCKRLMGPSGVNVLADLSVSPLAIVVAFLYLEVGWPSLPLSLLPLLFIRHAYLTSFRLGQANHDLLRALVKAIETRDPYTSGHSQRVARLAGRIARELRMGARTIETVEMAALLHDVGKIDVVYTELLRKREALTTEERRTMESHVTKGVELLRSLASVPDDVVAFVRHHHEREDGRGYPEGLFGHEIPLGSKIIKVCDAIDAMLSDRPYRSALTREQVRDQLRQHAGTEFDAAVVGCVLGSLLLDEHVQIIGAAEYEQMSELRVARRAPARRRAGDGRRAVAF